MFRKIDEGINLVYKYYIYSVWLVLVLEIKFNF